jgi:hypothetical protein
MRTPEKNETENKQCVKADKQKQCRVFGVRAQIRRAFGSPGGRGAMHRSEIGV